MITIIIIICFKLKKKDGKKQCIENQALAGLWGEREAMKFF